jgi:DUF971 family protein
MSDPNPSGPSPAGTRAGDAVGTSAAITVPREIKLKRAEQELWIRWPDGAEHRLSAVVLRKNCPCASCKTEREKQSSELLPVLKQAPAESITLTGAQLVGTYAIQLFWSDGHSTGMYDYRYLRKLGE